ncbi:MAG TPA: alpha/beta hydrolase [Stellaceae bacterium]|nr:alpha/beta hydrolase [Stellaceae bacterium]
MSAINPAFKREELSVNGIKTVMLTAGKGEPLMLWHGAGTFHGFDFALPWAEHFRVLIPFHPGFGLSADDPSITGIHDYVMHYVELLDQLGLASVNLVGFSLGGYIAASFAAEHGHRIRKLVLVAPAGLRVPEHPMVDLFRVPPEQVPGYLVANMEVLLPHLPKGPDIDFMVERYRESTSLARVAWERSYDPKLPKWLHRLRMPTLLVWGNQDRLIPVGQAAAWAKLIPDARIRSFDHAGHLVLDESPDSVRAITDFLS